MALNGNDLGQELYDALGLESEIESQEGMDAPSKAKAKSEALNKQKTVANTIIKHILNNMEIKGVKAKIDNPAVSTSVNTTVAPGILTTPAVIGAPSTTVTPGSGTGAGSGQVNSPQVSQTNDGTGLVK